jgi:hypothetical protein
MIGEKRFKVIDSVHGVASDPPSLSTETLSLSAHMFLFRLKEKNEEEEKAGKKNRTLVRVCVPSRVSGGCEQSGTDGHEAVRDGEVTVDDAVGSGGEEGGRSERKGSKLLMASPGSRAIR